MPPFTPKHVTYYLLWIGLVLVAVIVLAWYLFESPARERIHSKHPGATVQLRLPDYPHRQDAATGPRAA